MIYRKQASLLALATALALPVASSADNLDFNYLELDCIDVDAGFSRSTTFEYSTVIHWQQGDAGLGRAVERR